MCPTSATHASYVHTFCRVPCYSQIYLPDEFTHVEHTATLLPYIPGSRVVCRELHEMDLVICELYENAYTIRK